MTSKQERLKEIDRILKGPDLDPRIRKSLFEEGRVLFREVQAEVWGERGLREGWLRPVSRWRKLPHDRMVASVQGHRARWVRFHTELQRCREDWPWDPVVAFAGALKGLPHGATVADFGAGNGALAQTLEQTRPDIQTRSFDLVAWDDRVEVADIASTPLEAGSTDAVVLSCALWGDSRRVLAECQRVLRVGGVLLVAEPCSHWREGELADAVSGAGFAVGGQGVDAAERFEYLQGVKGLSLV